MKTLLFSLFFSSSVFCFETNLNSSELQTQVIELFTSEGCSSCPPAERYLSKLKTSPDLFKTFIPIAFHVDYWDYIGWKDKLALQKNTVRQQVHKILGNINSVYTPGMIKSGKEWRAWRFSSVLPSPLKVGKLSVNIKNSHLNVTFVAQEKPYNLNIALLGMNITSKIKAGENKGKFLTHDFVLLKHEQYPSKSPQWQFNIDEDFFNSQHTKLAFVAWVEDEKNPSPIQAVATFL